MRQTWIVVCVIVLLPLIGCGQMAAKTEATENPLVTYSTPSYKPAFSGVDHTIRELARRAASLVDEHEDHLLGSYVDKAGRVVVVAGSAEGARLAEESFRGQSNVTIRQTSVTLRAVHEFGDKLRGQSPRLMDIVTTWGAKPEIDGMFVWVIEQPTEEDRRSIAAFASESGIPINVVVDAGGTRGSFTEDRLTDPSAYAGGHAGVGRWAPLLQLTTVP